jgi:hypothetical protein
MAASKIAEKFAKLKKAKHGWSLVDNLSAAQRKEFFEWVEIYRRTPLHDRPNQTELAKAMGESLGVHISKHTLTRHLRDDEHTNRAKVR